MLNLDNIKKPDSDSNSGTSMGFLEHLDELRSRIIKVAVFVLIAFIICWGFSKPLYNFLSKPVIQALRNVRVKTITSASKLQNFLTLPDGNTFTFVFTTQTSIEEATIPTGTAIQARITHEPNGKYKLSSVQPLVVGQYVIPEGTSLPITNLGTNQPDLNNQLVVHTVQGAFNLYVKVAFYGAIFFSIPYILYQIYAFVSPGLYKHEKAYIWPILGMATVFFLLGAAFGYYIAFPRTCQFLIGEAENFQPYIEVNDYFDLIITIILGLGIVFEIPTIVFFLARIGLVTARSLLKIWRIAIIAIFILAAIISPTSDIPNMMVFAVPMLALYYLSVAIAFFFGKPRQIET